MVYLCIESFMPAEEAKCHYHHDIKLLFERTPAVYT